MNIVVAFENVLADFSFYLSHNWGTEPVDCLHALQYPTPEFTRYTPAHVGETIISQNSHYYTLPIKSLLNKKSVNALRAISSENNVFVSMSYLPPQTQSLVFIRNFLRTHLPS